MMERKVRLRIQLGDFWFSGRRKAKDDAVERDEIPTSRD